jgi:pyruvate/2-oxoglutarate dehydrogenase complex dihydrolipoamide acyltransferase (E2) component
MIPHETVNDDSVTLIAWLVANGEPVTEGQAVASVETSKAVMDIHAPSVGLLQTLYNPGDEVPVGGMLGRIYQDASHPPDPAKDSAPGLASSFPAPQTKTPVHSNENRSRVPAGERTTEPKAGFKAKPEEEEVVSSPSNYSGAKRFSKKALELLDRHKISPALFDGYALIRAADVLQRIPQDPPAAQPDEPSDSPNAPNQVPVRRVKLSKRKQAEVNNLSWGRLNTLPSAVSVQVSTRGLKAAASRHEKLAGNTAAIVLYEVGRLLRKYPEFNAFSSDGAVYFYEEVNVGFAIDAGRGLKVPIIRNADTKSVLEIAEEMQELLVSYLNDQINTGSLAGGTFTITDLSGQNVLTFHPLLNMRQSAILGIGAEYPNGGIERFFNLILSFDHQISEGRQAAEFLEELSRRLRSYEEALRLPEDDGDDACSRCLAPLAELRHRNHYLVLTIGPSGSTQPVCTVCLQGM